MPAALAAVVTTGVVGVAVVTGGSTQPAPISASAPAVASSSVRSDTSGASGFLEDRTRAVSRSAPRVTLHELPKVRDRKYMTASLNLWAAPREQGRPLAVLHEGGRVALTGVSRGAFAQVLRDGRLRWVKKAYLVDKRPSESAGGTAAGSSAGSSAGVTSAPCPDGSGTESGLTSSAVRLFRSVCNAFPALTTYGGWDAHGEHSSGRAIDFMISDSSLGQAVADWARAHAAELGLYDVIWAQHIWTPVRAGEGWRAMPNRGSATANHFDHVHIAVN